MSASPPDTTSDRTRGAALRRGGSALLGWLQRHARAVLVVNLVLQIAIVGTGGAVRLTASGLGCSTWPQCEPGSFVPVVHDATTYHVFVEFGNRLMTFVLAAAAVAVAAVVWPDRGRALSYRRLGWLPVGGVVAQAVIGGVLVLLELPPILVSLHFLASMVLVAGSLVLLQRHDEGHDGPVVVIDQVARRLAHALAVILSAVLVLGTMTTGAGPHSGDDEVGYRLAVDPMLMAKVHAAAVWAFVAILLALLWRTRRSGPCGDVAGPTHRAGLLLLALSLAQAVIGYVQTATGLPIALVNLHLVGAALLAAAGARVWLATRVRSTTAGDATPAQPDAPVATAH